MRQGGLEPPTNSLEGCRSIQLSYWRGVPHEGESSRGDWIRTSDLLLPKQARYRATLRPEARDSVRRTSESVNQHRWSPPRARRDAGTGARAHEHGG